MKVFSDGSYCPINEFKLRDNDDVEMALWPVGLQPKQICSWSSFLRIWKAYLPNLKIKPPLLDTCYFCDKYAKYMTAKKQSQITNLPSLLNNDSLLCPESNKISLLEKGFGDMEETRENVFILASKHVKAARSQKILSKMKFDAAGSTIGAEPSKRTISLVIDYCQNLDLPHLGGEQPGDTYYYPPVWIYCLRIVDTSEDKLYAYIHKESDAKKRW